MTLSILIWLPFTAGLVGLALPPRVVARWAAVICAVSLGLAISYAVRFHSGQGLQFVTDRSWISVLGAHYKLGLDGLNVFLVLTTAVVFLGAVLIANLREWERPGLFYFQLGLAQSGVLGAFCSQDLLLFVAFFDLMLIPFYFLIGVWGGPDRQRATLKLFIYTLVGSLLMLAAAVATAILAAGPGQSVSFALSDLAARPLGNGTQDWIFLCFAAAFLIKMPSFPFHGWLPDGYKNMPIPALAAFSGIVSKVAAFGFLRVALPLFPHAAHHYQTLILLLALASVLYGSAMAFTTTDARLIVGFSSIAQLGFITLGIFAFQQQGAQGALLQIVNHAVVTVPLFFIVYLLSQRAGGSEDLRDMGGLAFRAPVLTTLFLIVAFANLAMPGSSNFIGEFMILLGLFKAKAVFACVAFVGVAAASVYMLRAFIRAMHNRVGEHAESREASRPALLVLGPMVAVIIALALYPQVALKKSNLAVSVLVSQQGELSPLVLEGSYNSTPPKPPPAAAAPEPPASTAPPAASP